MGVQLLSVRRGWMERRYVVQKIYAKIAKSIELLHYVNALLSRVWEKIVAV